MIFDLVKETFHTQEKEWLILVLFVSDNINKLNINNKMSQIYATKE